MVEGRRYNEITPTSQLRGLYVSPMLSDTLTDGTSWDILTQNIESTIGIPVLSPAVLINSDPVVYPRDLFQVFDDLIVTATPEMIPEVQKYLNGPYEVLPSWLGIGGKVLRSGKTVVLAEELRMKLHELYLTRRGYSVDYLPLPPHNGTTELARRMSHNRHIDTECNIIMQDNIRIIVVNALYYDSFQSAVDTLAAKHQAEVVVVSNSREQTLYRAVNFVELPNGQILMPDECLLTELLLKEKLGNDKVLVAPINCSQISLEWDDTDEFGNVTTTYGHGGLRCMTNIVY